MRQFPPRYTLVQIVYIARRLPPGQFLPNQTPHFNATIFQNFLTFYTFRKLIRAQFHPFF